MYNFRLYLSILSTYYSNYFFTKIVYIAIEEIRSWQRRIIDLSSYFP